MAEVETEQGLKELARFRARSNTALFSAIVFSVFVNVLMLTSPIYMLQVYDRVLISRSQETLIALSALAAFLFLIMGVLDHARSRVMSRIGARLQAETEERVMSAAFRRLIVAPMDAAAHSAQADIDTLGKVWATPAKMALFDLPWTPVFCAMLFVFHPWMGWTAIGGMVLLIVVTLANQHFTEAPLQDAGMATLRADRQAQNLKSESELIRALGMTGSAFARWQTLRTKSQEMSLSAADTAGAFATLTKTFRLFLQSAILGIGAWLVLLGELSAGAMIAGSILMGRALQPVEVAIGQWSVLTRARQSRDRIAGLLSRTPVDAPRTALPRPAARIEVKGLSLVPPGDTKPVLRGVSFTLEPGQAMGVIGASGSGKSSLARALIGVWPPSTGTIRLDGATLDQYDPDSFGRYVGYLPQRVSLFDGTIAENISRLDTNADPKAIVAAAEKAAAHELIKALPQGYDTQVATVGGRLSGGQIQRIGLARALYGNPVFLVLDEPNSNLDNDGSMALNVAIRTAKAEGRAVLIMAHRPAAIQECDLLMVMKDGAVAGLGPRDQILREMVKNAGDIARSVAPGGAS